jgi:hypothetical protein
MYIQCLFLTDPNKEDLIELDIDTDVRQFTEQDKVRFIFNIYIWDRHGRDHMVVGFTTTCALSVYHP